VIGGLLRRLIDTDPDERLEIVVVANGCTDDTALVASQSSARVQVVEVPAPSKIAALRAGDDAATAFPRAYLDADVLVDATALLAVADALGAPLYAGAPRMTVDTTGASVWVRWQYKVWELTDYRTATMIGSGLYVLSEAGRARFGEFPDVIADDGYVLRLFDEAERVVVDDVAFSIRAPRTLRSFIRRQARILAGNEQLNALFPERAPAAGSRSHASLLRRLVTRPALWIPAAAYLWVRLIARVQARRVRGNWRSQAWNRDATSR